MVSKKVKVFAVGAFVFAKVKGYPAWPAKITGLVGKRYGIYFYGTGESATLPPNEIFDYFEHKSAFAAKGIKRKFYQEGVDQLEAELQETGITSNQNLPDESLNASQIDTSKTSIADQSTATVEDEVEAEPAKPETPTKPVEEKVVEKPAPKKRGRKSSTAPPKEVPAPAAVSTTVEEPVAQVEPTEAEEPTAPSEPEAASEPTPVEEQPAPVEEPVVEPQEIIQESVEPVEEQSEDNDEEVPAPAPKGRGKRGPAKTPTTAPPAKTPRRSTKPEAVSPKPEPKTPLPEGTSRSGRKIKPKKFIDEEMEELSPIAEPPTKKTKSIGSDEEQPEPVQEEQQPVKEVEQETPVKKAPVQKNHSPKKTPAVVRRENGTNRRSDPSYKIVHPHEIQDIKETITQSYGDDVSGGSSVKHTLLAILPGGKIVGIKLFTDAPDKFPSTKARVQWENASAKTALKLKEQLENGEIDSSSVLAQLDMDVPLLEEEIDSMKKQRSTEAQKSRLSFLRTEFKLVELSDQVTGTLCFDSADTDLCIELLDQMAELDVRCIMLIKHPNVMETVKRCRRYVGNLEHWKMTPEEKTEFSLKAQIIRSKAEHCYTLFKNLFGVEDNRRFWEFFSLKVHKFKEITAKMNEIDILEICTEPRELAELSADDIQVVEVNSKSKNGAEQTKTSTKQASRKLEDSKSPKS